MPRLTMEKLARACARHPWWTIGAWAGTLALAIVVIVLFLGSALTTEQAFTGMTESKEANQLLEERLRGPEKVTEIVLVSSPELTVDDPAFREKVGDLYGRVLALGPDVVEGGVAYTVMANPALVSPDRHTTVMPFTMAGGVDIAGENIGKLLAVVDEANGGQDFEVLVTGGASIGSDFQHIAEQDLLTGEMIGVGVAMIILVIVFGTLVAAAIPVGLALVAITMAIGASALIGQVSPLSFFVTNMITMMGLAVGIDYSLFVVSRFREERFSGRDTMDALGRTGSTASRAVLFSGMAVIFSLGGLLIVPTSIFRSLSIGAMLVVAVSVAAALTLLPAVLGLLGDRVDSLRVPYFGRKAVEGAHGKRGGFWDRASGAVMAHPWVSVVAATTILVVAGYSYFDISTGQAGVSSLPEGAESKRGFIILEEQFSQGLLSPVEVVLVGDVAAPETQAALARLQQNVAGDQDFTGPLPPETNTAGDLMLVPISLADDPQSEAATKAVERLRDEYIPAAFADAPVRVLVTGVTAINADFFDIVDRYTPWVFAFVLGLSFILLTLLFRSLVVPIKAILMNLLSVGAAYGLIVLVFQKGYGADVLGLQQIDTIEAWIPLFLFSVLFGLSMDYHVFLLSRIRERYDETRDNTESVRYGLRTTAAIITGAALIMVAVFTGFAAGQLVMFQQLGFGLAVAIFLDATLVRIVLVPAAMRLLGDANWWLPRVLGWLPDLRPEAAPIRVAPPSVKPAAESAD